MGTGRLKLIGVLVAAGVLFSGYLSGTKFFTATCAFNEPCPYFLGYPACYFGFALFVILALLAVQYGFGGLTRSVYLKGTMFVSGIGILFAGYFTVPEIPPLLAGTIPLLGLPTCAYGFLVFAGIFVLSVIALRE